MPDPTKELVKKKKVRGAHRGAATKLLHKADSLLSHDFNLELEKNNLKQIRDSAMEKIATLRALDDEILELLVDADTAEADLEEILNEGDVLRGRLHTVIYQIEELIAQKEQPTLNTSVQDSVSSQSGNAPYAKVRAKLPKLEVKKFHGKIQEWPEFWDAFESAIDKNEFLSDVDKFAYLRGLLTDEVKPTIAGFALTAANYHAAVELLQKRYGKQDAIQRAHINDLLNLPPVYHDGDLARLRRFYDDVETHYRGLQALTVQESVYSAIVVPALIQKLPNAFRLIITRGHPDFMAWSMEKLLNQIKTEVELREEHTISGATSTHVKQHAGAHKSTGSALFIGLDGHGTCVYCLGKHDSEKCEKVKSPGERKKLLVKYARCFKCLRKNHRSFDCRSKGNSCKNCGGAHHVSICESLSKSSSPAHLKHERGENGQTGEFSSSHVVSGIAQNFHVGSGTRVALQTAQGIVSEEGDVSLRTRFLFDAGSQRSFITATSARKAKLPVVRQEILCINAFGQRNQKGTLREVVEFNVRPVDGDDCIRMQVFVVPDISSIPNGHVELARDRFPHLKGLWFSDVNRNAERLEIDILVGADYVWQFQGGGVIRGKVQEL